jgi:hypothetical protein
MSWPAMPEPAEGRACTPAARMEAQRLQGQEIGPGRCRGPQAPGLLKAQIWLEDGHVSSGLRAYSAFA